MRPPQWLLASGLIALSSLFGCSSSDEPDETNAEEPVTVRGSCEPTGMDATCTNLVDRWPGPAAEKLCEATHFRQSTYCTGYYTAGGCKGDGALFGAPGYAYTRWYYLDLGKGGYTEEEVPALCAAADPPLEHVPPE